MNQRLLWVVNANTNDVLPFADSLFAETYHVHKLRERPLDFLREQRPAVIVLDMSESRAEDLDVIVAAGKAVPPIPVLAVVSQNQVQVAIDALKAGVFDVVVSPVKPADLIPALRRIREKEEKTALLSSQDEVNPAGLESAVFVSRNEKMAKIWDVATTVARTDVPVLILGESGVGKEILAKFIHRHSRRADHPLIKVNCAALPHDLLESELFGYERGAFTGAVGDKPGKFELANKGSLILDEIGEITPNLQAKLLHVLEDGEFTKLGGRQSIKVDVRVLALTNRKLEKAIPRGEFREDLYFRLNVVTLNIPPLSERRDDIPLLCNYFLNKHRDALESSVQELPPSLMKAFLRSEWPGNVRQLENAVRRYLILPHSEMDVGIPELKSAEAAGAANRSFAAVASATRSGEVADVIPFPSRDGSVFLKAIVAKAAERAEREVVLRILEQSNWNRRRAAQRLNICYRGLLNKLKKWQVRRPPATIETVPEMVSERAEMTE
jgi:two-component system response regulator AtoC